MKKKEKLFIAGILLFAAAMWLILSFLRPRDYGSIQITVNGDLLGTYSLGKDQVIEIGDTNVCEIKDGKARMISATCPDHLCIDQQGPIDEKGGMIICLPNRVVIEGEKASSGNGSSDGSGVDAIA